MWAKSKVRRPFALLQYGQKDLENMTILLPAMASSTVCLADMAVLGEEDVGLEKKDPIVRLYIPRSMGQAEQACTGVTVWVINAFIRS